MTSALKSLILSESPTASPEEDTTMTTDYDVIVMDLLDEAAEKLVAAHSNIQASGLVDDIGEDENCRRLRRLSEDVSDLRDRIEENGLVI